MGPVYNMAKSAYVSNWIRLRDLFHSLMQQRVNHLVYGEKLALVRGIA